MTDIGIRDVIAVLTAVIALVSMAIVSRNARRATAVNAQSLDLARIRDLRSELKETKEELTGVRTQARELSQHLTEANERAIMYARREAEMLNYARMPGMDMQTWLRRFDPDGSQEILRR